MIPVPLVSNQYSINIASTYDSALIEPLSISAATDSVEDDVLIISIFIGTIALLVVIIIITVTVMCIINYKRYYDCSNACIFIIGIVRKKYCLETLTNNQRSGQLFLKKNTDISLVVYSLKQKSLVKIDTWSYATKILETVLSIDLNPLGCCLSGVT